MSQNARLTQDVRLVARRRMTDRGRLRVTFKVMIAAYGPDGDRGRGVLRFLDASHETISSRSTRWVSNSGVRYVSRTITTALPRGTRYIRVQLQGARNEGLYCNAYFDKVRLELSRR
jgi:hypothetical protein